MGAVQQKTPPRGRIIAAARNLFSSRGFHQTAMSELATEADVSVGQIYRQFSGKNAVICAIVLEDADTKIVELRKLLEDVSAGRLSIEAGFVELARRSLSKGDEALSFEIMAEAHRNAAVSDTIASLCTGFRAIIRDLACLANPSLSSGDLDGAEEMLLAFMFGLGHRTLSRPRLAEEDTARMSGKMILGALNAL